MSNEPHRNGWNEWSKHVLRELQRLNAGQESIQQEMHDIKISMSKVTTIENQVKEVREWKKEISEVASPSQFKELRDKVNDLEKFKIKTIAIFTFIQIIFAAFSAAFFN